MNDLKPISILGADYSIDKNGFLYKRGKALRPEFGRYQSNYHNRFHYKLQINGEKVLIGSEDLKKYL